MFFFFRPTVIAEANIPLDRLRSLSSQMFKALSDFKRCINEAKELHNRQIERLQRERDAALLAASQVEDPNSQLPPGVEITNKKVRAIVFILSGF
jgi:deformed epidermal autoregulatory factor 1